MPLFPNVPNVLGVPPLPRDLAAAFVPPIVLLVGDLLGIFGTALGPRWGLFQDGVPVVVPDNVISFDYKQGWTLATYPIEGGGFESYDKVNMPADARLRVSTGGTEADRQDLLDAITAIAGTTELFDVVTPERVYPNFNVQRFDYRRTSREGAGLLIVDIWLLEVRPASEPAFSSTQSADGAAAQNTGTVSPTEPTAAETSAAVAGID